MNAKQRNKKRDRTKEECGSREKRTTATDLDLDLGDMQAYILKDAII